jgi:tetratricopeptide (TPR) repeat protein
MSFSSWIRLSHTVFSLIFGGVVLIVGVSEFLGHGLSNAGMLMLNDVLASERAPHQGLQEAESTLRQATRSSPDHRSAWRALGFVLAFQGREEEATVAWQTAGGMADEFIRRGQLAEDDGQSEVALEWYERAALMSPEWADIRFYIGSIRQDEQQWVLALQAYDDALRLGRFRDIGASDVYLQRGLIYQLSTEFKDLDAAVQMYDQALNMNQFSTDGLKAEVYYRRGETYGWQNSELEKRLESYRQAVMLNPDHYWARLRLGYALYWTHGELASAEAAILQAVERWPADDVNKKWAYLYLGNIYRDADLTDEAIIAYEEALRFDPEDTQLQATLNMLKGK